MKSNFIKFISLGLAAILLMGNIDSQAQMYHFGKSTFRYKKDAGRKQNNNPFTAIFIGYNYNLPYQIHFNHYFAGNDLEGRYINEYEYTRSVLATPVLSLSGGTHFPILNFNEKMILAFTLGAEVNLVKANTETIHISPFQQYQADFLQYTYSIPFGVAVKYGCDASLVTSDRFSGSFGIAAAPSLVMTDFGDYFSDMSFKVTPFVFAEVGVFAGINWKIRGTCMPFGIAGFKRSPGDIGMDAFPTNTSINAKSDPIFQIGISAQPFSFLWDRYHW